MDADTRGAGGAERRRLGARPHPRQRAAADAGAGRAGAGMTPDRTRDGYRRALAAAGELVTVRRYVGTGVDRPVVEAQVAARVTGYAPSELVGNIRPGDSRVVLLVEDLEARQFPLPPPARAPVVVGR